MAVYKEKDYTNEVGRVVLPASTADPAVFVFGGNNTILTIQVMADSYFCYTPWATVSGNSPVIKDDTTIISEANTKLDNAAGVPPLQYWDMEATTATTPKIYSFDNVPAYTAIAVRSQASAVTASGGGIQFSFGQNNVKFNG